MSDLSPRASFERVLGTWWIVAGLMILGGVAGWGFSRFHPPLYEAAATYEVSLDQAQLAARLSIPASQLPLDDIAENVYLAPVEIVFDDPEVRQSLVSAANAQGINLKYQEITQDHFSIDRRGTIWLIRVQSASPVSAARLANLWVSIADTALRQAHAHSDRAQALQVQRSAVQKCFSDFAFVQANQCAGTSFSSPTDLQAYLAQLDQQISAEVQADWNIDPALTFMIAQPVEVPGQPVLDITGELILASSVIGLLAGVVIAQLIPFERVHGR
jgi:uncharacterized protein involved in exopolysaccharide biosynthesis